MPNSLSRVRKKLLFATIVFSRLRNPSLLDARIENFYMLFSMWHRHCIIIHQCSCTERAFSAAYILTRRSFGASAMDRSDFKIAIFFTPFFLKFSSICCFEKQLAIYGNDSSWIFKIFLRIFFFFFFTWPFSYDANYSMSRDFYRNRGQKIWNFKR